MKLRDISLLSVFSPLRHGDSVILEGESGADEWFASRADCGWSLKNDAGELHPAIKEIDGMNDFIGAIIEWQSAYFTRF